MWKNLLWEISILTKMFLKYLPAALPIFLGVHLPDLGEDLAPYFNVKPHEGVLILDVEEDSPAEEANLKPGDVITSIDGEKVTDPQSVSESLSDFEKDDEVELAIFRQGKPQKIKVTLAERENMKNIIIGSPKSNRELYFGPNRYLFNWQDKNIKIDRPSIRIDKNLRIKSFSNTISSTTLNII